MKYADVVNAWNELADPHNQWNELGEDEKIEFSAGIERERCIQLCEAIARDWWKYPSKSKNPATLCVEAIRERGDT